MRLIDADQFGVISLQGKSDDFIDGVAFMFDKIHEAPTIEERPHGEWKVYSHCSDGFSYKCSLCERVVNSDYWYEQKEILSVYPYCHCGAKMIAVEDPIKWYSGLGLRAKMGLIDDAADTKPDLEYLKVGDTIYTQDSDKQGWIGREENK